MLLYIVNNTVRTTAERATFAWFRTDAPEDSDPNTPTAPALTAEYTLADNLYVAPYLKSGYQGGGTPDIFSAVLVVEDDAKTSGMSSLYRFRTIQNNVWPTTRNYSGWSGPMYVGTGVNPFNNSSNMRTETAWAGYGETADEAFTDVSLADPTGSPPDIAPQGTDADTAVPFLGIFEDFYGNGRPPAGSWTAGAAQPGVNLVGTNLDDHWYLRAVSGNLEIHSGDTATGPLLRSIPLSSVGTVNVFGQSGSDKLTVDYSTAIAYDGANIPISFDAADADSLVTTAIGYGEAGAYLGLSGAQTATWDGQTVEATTLLLKFNYDGARDATDTYLLDNAYANQGPQL